MPTRLSRYCEGLIEAAWLAAVVLVPVFFNIYSSRIFEPDKIALLRSLALVILGAWIVKIIDTGRVTWENAGPGEGVLRSFIRIPLILPVALLALIYILSTIFSVTQRASLWGSYQRLQGTYTTLSYLIIFAAMLGNLRRREQVERLITTIIISSLPVSLYGFLQRYRIDPIPWGGDTSRRIASNMGNSIFVAAYLIMVFPLTVGRIIETFRGIMKDTGQPSNSMEFPQTPAESSRAASNDMGLLSAQMARGTIYVFIALVQLIAIYMSGSRGPVLGLFVGTFVMFLLLTWHWGKRGLTNVIVGAAILGIVFLAVFNIPSGPLEGLRRSPAIGRFGLLLDAESNSALVRRYIWEGTVKLVSPHTPLQFPGGGKDRYNFLRPLIGYGPESMYVAFNPFYIPELGQVEKRNASPDRAHNETWDAMVITGALGLAVYLATFLLVFFYSLSWIGLLNGPFQRSLFLGLCAAGAGAGSVFLTLWRGVEYIALGLPLGLVGGLVIFILYAVYANQSPVYQTEGDQSRRLLLILLLVIVISHFLEINFGIAIAITRTLFWMDVGLIILVGYLLLKKEASGARTDSGSQIDSGQRDFRDQIPQTTRRKLRKGERRRERGPRGETGARTTGTGIPAWLQLALPEAGIAGLLLVTLGYDFISNSGRYTSVLDVLRSSLTRLPNQNNVQSFGILALVLTTWLGIGILLGADKAASGRGRSVFQAALPILVISGGIAFLFSLWHAATLAGLVKIEPRNIPELMIQVNRVGSLLTNFYFFSFLLIFALAIFFMTDWRGRSANYSLSGSLVGLILVLVTFWVIYFTNLRVIHADIAFKMAEPFNKPEQWAVATELYKYTNTLAPDQDHYYLFLGRSYLEQAKAESDPVRQDQLLREAEQELKIAQRRNPLNTDHTANLGRLYSWWASRAQDTQIRQERGQIASNYYATATTLSPQNSTLWGEWAVLYLDVLNRPEEAYLRLERALSLDPKYNWTQGLMGDYYLRTGQSITDTVKKKEAFQQALDHYTQALQVSKSGETQAMIGYWVDKGRIYEELGQLADAVAAYEEAVKLKPSSSDLWKFEETIARTYLSMGDKQNALIHASAALEAAPEDQKSRINQLIDQIKGSTQ